MLTLAFENPITHDSETVGPVAYYRIVGSSLREGPLDREVATYHEGTWHVGTRSFLSVRVGGPVTAEFRDGPSIPAAQFGPLEAATLMDGVLRYGPRLAHALARLDEDTAQWHVYPEQRDFPVLLVRPA
jgi:hypothetical protein